MDVPTGAPKVDAAAFIALDALLIASFIPSIMLPPCFIVFDDIKYNKIIYHI
jgi:hypothetical protein